MNAVSCILLLSSALVAGMPLAGRGAVRLVTTLADGGTGSLREVIATSQAGTTVQFTPTLSGATLVLTAGPLVLNRALTIDASNLPGGIVLSGGGASRVLEVRPGDLDSRATVGPTVVLDSLTITGGVDEVGAGMLNDGGGLILRRCLFRDNHATLFRGGGGGLASLRGTLVVENSTFTANASASIGGAMLLQGEDHLLRHVTIVDNQANTAGAGVYVSGRLRLVNSLVTRNGGPSLTRTEHAEVILVTSLLSGDPWIAPLGDYGGPTWTMPPLAGSSAVDRGTNLPEAVRLAMDQRGQPRAVDGDGDGLAQPDLGAAEMIGNLTVTTLADAGPGSLRDAIAFARAGATIDFAPRLSGGTIVLTGGPLRLWESVTLDASGLPQGITLSGSGRFRVMEVRRRRREITVSLDSITITGGARESGAGVFCLEARLVVRRCVFHDNHASGPSGDGGAIMMEGGTLVLENSTLTRNTAVDSGGALCLHGRQHRIQHTTIVGNDAGGSGDGIYLTGSLLLHNSIVAGNGEEDLGWGAYPALTAAHCLLSGDPRLAPLGDFGGPTWSMPPLPGSPAIDAGGMHPSFPVPAGDQRGEPRIIDGDRDGTGQADLGAVEYDPVAAGRPGLTE